MLPKSILKFLIGAVCLVYFPFGSTPGFAEGQARSAGCSKGDSSAARPLPFDVGDGNNYGQHRLELTVPSKCQCDDNECTPCAIVVGYHGYSETGTSNHS